MVSHCVATLRENIWEYLGALPGELGHGEAALSGGGQLRLQSETDLDSDPSSFLCLAV